MPYYLKKTWVTFWRRTLWQSSLCFAPPLAAFIFLCLSPPPLFFWVLMGQNSIDSPSTAHWSRVSARRPSSPTSTGQRRVVIETHHLRLKIWTEYMCDSSSVSLCRLAHWKIGSPLNPYSGITFTHTDRWVAKVFRVAARWLLTSTFHKDPKSLCTRISPSMPFGSFMIHQVKIVHLL